MQTKTQTDRAAFFPAWILALLALPACGGGGSDAAVDPPSPEILTLGAPVVVAEADQATLAWTTNLPTTGTVEYGSNSFTLQSVPVAGNQSNHQLVLQGLQPGSHYQYRITVVSGDGQTRSSGYLDFTTRPRFQFEADDFFANNLDLDRWTFLDPLETGQLRMLAGSTGEGALELSIPPGGHSSPWLHLDGTRLTQAVQDVDLALEVSFLSALDQEATGKGLVFEQDADNWARFDFAYNGGRLQLFAAVFQNGALQTMRSSNLQTGPWLSGSELRMRVVRTGSVYTQSYSLAGGPWIAGPSLNSNMVLAHAGILVAAEGVQSGGVTAVIDSIELVDQPLASEDGALAQDLAGPFVYGLRATALDNTSMEVRFGTDEPANAEIRFGQTPAVQDGLVVLGDTGYRQSAWVNGLQPGAHYYVQVTAYDALGQSSSSMVELNVPATASANSPTISVWGSFDATPGYPVLRFGQQGFAQPQVNVRGNVQDADEDRLVQTVSLEYRLDNGAWLPLAMGDDRTISYAPWRLVNEGDFNVELFLANLMEGTPSGGLFTHELMLRATDDEGHVTYQAVRLEVVDGATWSPDYSIDWSSVLAQGGDPSQVCQIIDGQWHVENVPGLGAVLRTDPATLGYDRLVGIGQGQGAGIWGNYEATLDATVLGLDPQGYTTGTNSYGFGFVLRWTGHTAGGPYQQPNHNIYPLGGAFLYRWFDTRERWEFWRGYDEGINSLAGATLAVGDHYSFKLRCESLPGGGSVYRMNRWSFGTTEPAAWTYERTTPSIDTIDFGSLVLVAHHADVAFGNVQVTGLP